MDCIADLDLNGWPGRLSFNYKALTADCYSF